jgi:hypothetical protein
MTGPTKVVIEDEAESVEPEPLQFVDLSGITSAEIHPPRFVINPIIPREYTTLFGSHGGAGKSIFSLTLCAHVACGVDLGPLRIDPGRALFVSLEDSAEVIRYRLRRIAEAYGLNPEKIAARLQVVDASERGALAVESNELGPRSLIFTPLAEQIKQAAAGVDLVVIDNASDAFDGNENERRMVRAFVRWLNLCVREHAGAVLLLAHIDKVAARYGANGNSYSGSTQWHNSARSRIAIFDGALVHEKLNLGKKLDAPMPLEWSDYGVLIPNDSGDRTSQAEQDRNDADDAAVLECIGQANYHADPVPVARTGPATTWHVLSNYAEFPKDLKGKDGKQRTYDALVRLHRADKIDREEFTDRHRHRRERWVVR